MDWTDMSPVQRNTLVAEKIMGWQRGPCDGEIGEKFISPDSWYCLKCGCKGPWYGDTKHESIPPRYSTDVSAAWQIAERFDEIIVSKHIPGKYHCELYRGTVSYKAVAKTVPWAICLAALKSVRVDAEEEQEKLITINYSNQQEEAVVTIGGPCTMIGFDCTNCGTRLQINKSSPESVLSAMFCPECDEQYYVRWNEGILRRGKIENEH